MQGNQEQPDEIQTLLEADENIIWQGEPARQQTAVKAKPYIRMGTFIFFASIIAGVIGLGVYWCSLPEESPFDDSKVIKLIPIISLLLMLTFLGHLIRTIASTIATWQFTARRYILTDRRLITLGPGNTKSMCFLDTVSTIALQPGANQYGVGGVTVNAGRSCTVWLGVSDAENVFRLIQHARNEAMSQRGNAGQHSP